MNGHYLALILHPYWWSRSARSGHATGHPAAAGPARRARHAAAEAAGLAGRHGGRVVDVHELLGVVAADGRDDEGALPLRLERRVLHELAPRLLVAGDGAP